MLEILPLEDKILQESLCLRCGISFDPELLAYGAYADGKPIGICQFAINNNVGILTDISTICKNNSLKSLFSLVLAVLNFLDLCGAHTAKCAAKIADERLLRAVGFSDTNSGMWEIKLSEA